MADLRITCALSFGTAFIGMGLLTAIPGTGLLLLMTGWLCAPATVASRAAARSPVWARAAVG